MNSGPENSPISPPRAYGEPDLDGVIRHHPQDFYVEEILGFEPAGEGEHVFLWIEKNDLNTEQVARLVAQQAGVPLRQVSYAGMKDRRAVTRQWFSVHLPGKQQLDWSAIESEQLAVLRCERHLKKLRRGSHSGNRFVLRVRELQGDEQSLNERLALVRRDGVPNYFGEQRFGFDGANVAQAERWFAGQFKPRRHQRGIYLSAARAYLFNAVLAERIRRGDWLRALPGELLMLAGSHSVFPLQQLTDEIVRRLAEGDIHPTGPLYGRPGKLAVTDLVQQLEAAALSSYPQLTTGLEAVGVDAERRALRSLPDKLNCHIEEASDGRSAVLSFNLHAGCFATAVVRELFGYRTATGEPQQIQNDKMRSSM